MDHNSDQMPFKPQLPWELKPKDQEDKIHDEYKKLDREYDEWFNRTYKFFDNVCPVALSGKNYCKNRYSNIIPFEKTRVRLLTYTENITTDYINASYIDLRSFDDEFLNPKNFYISTQAPRSDQITAFWLMVWENKSPIIVMLTRFSEKGRIKANPYWVFSGNKIEIGNGLFITLTGKKNIGKYLIHRTFILSKVVEEKSLNRIIEHYQYREWPDHGRPKTTETIRKLIQITNDCRKLKRKEGLNGPPIFHCSAGVGRTGAFIAIDVGIRMVKDTQTVNVPKIVKQMRRYRMFMVQNPDQYKFIYDAIEDESKAQKISQTSSKRTRLLSLSAPPEINRSTWKPMISVRKDVYVLS